MTDSKITVIFIRDIYAFLFVVMNWFFYINISVDEYELYFSNGNDNRFHVLENTKQDTWEFIKIE